MNSELLSSLSTRQREILEFMEKSEPYSSQEIADVLGVKLPRTRQLLNELISLGLIQATAATKNRKYIKI
ncbi:MAG: MarR family transcriptional regulator [Clostridiales bacterium]|nr:MarR family transcriptional regulator [Clostridiales bacterium]